MNLLKKISPFLYLLAFAIPFIGCSSSGQTKMKHTEWCRIRYENAEELFKKGKYGRTTDKLEEILATCAGTGYMEQAQFLMAESYFNMEDWIEARGEYGSFILNFPGSPFIETAEFRKAISSFNMEFRVSRDEANTTIAMKDFERYLSNYPDSPLRDSVNYYYNLLIERLAEKEFQTARLYMRMDKYQAAVIYLKEFLETYPNSKRHTEALFMITEAYNELDQFETAKLYLNIARNEASPDDKDIQKKIAKNEKAINKSELAFEKRMKKDSQKKRFWKEDRQMQN